MKIQSLQLKNFRGLLDEYLQLDPSMTVLSGSNGGGKSSILSALSIMLSWLPVQITNSWVSPIKIQNSDITHSKDYTQLVMTLADKTSDDINLILTKEYSKNAKADMSQAQDYGSNMRVLLDSPEGHSVDIPVFAYYGTDRNSTGKTSPLPSNLTDRTSIYAKAFDAGTNFKKFAKWLTDAILERELEMFNASKMQLTQANKKREQINIKYNAVYAVKKALRAFSDTFDGFCVKNRQLFLESKNIPASNLSDGEKTVIALIADIAMRMSVANPLKHNPLNTSAIVLIDELDLHLHPDWQTAIAEKLPIIFKNAQFIISSHSPSIMAVSKNLYRLRDDSNTDRRLEKVESSYGRSPADLLTNVLNASRENQTSIEISTMYKAIDKGMFKEAEIILDKLHKTIPEDSELVRAEYLIRALKPKK